MSDIEREEQLLLSRARAGLAPASDATARMRRAIDSAVAAAGSVAEPARPDASNGLAAHAGSRAARLLVAVTIAGAAGTAGYLSGYRAGGRDAHVASNVSASAPAASDAVAAVPVEQSPLRSGAPVAGGARPVAEAIGARPRSGAQRVARAAPEPAAAESLAKEVAALRGIERALRDGQPGLALALLQELDRAVPDGKLVEEREATAAIARCALGRVPLGVDLVDDFAEHHPDSVYLKRVEQSCTRRQER